MNPNKFLVTITDIQEVDFYKKASVTNFLFPLKDFSVGFPNTFAIDEIEEGFLYINRVLDSSSLKKLKEILSNIPDAIQGIVFEDFGVITIAKELNLKQQLILYQTHFATNYQSINANLKFVNSVVLGTDITKEETIEILKNTNKPLVYVLYGLVPAMYSRRTLLTNFSSSFQLEGKKIASLKEQSTKEPFLAVENEYGTVLYHGKYYNGIQDFKEVEDSILYYLINPIFLNKEEIEELLKDLKCQKKREKEYESEGFLNTKTIYRLKEDFK